MKMRKQKWIGLSLIGISAALLLMVSEPGSAPEDRDATAVLLTFPLGVYMTVTQNYILFDSDPTEGRKSNNLKGAFQNGKKKSSRSPRAQVVGRR